MQHQVSLVLQLKIFICIVNTSDLLASDIVFILLDHDFQINTKLASPEHTCLTYFTSNYFNNLTPLSDCVT